MCEGILIIMKRKEKVMKKFNKFLALGLAGASLLTGGLMLSGCDITDDKDTTQTEQNQDEQKVVTSISINTNTLPSYIIRGKFNRANIKATVTYEDNTRKVIDVTESMLDETSKEEVKYAGQYNLTINHGGKTATMYANVVDERYLLKEVVEENLNKDVTIVNDDGSYQQSDADNKIVHYDDGAGHTAWVWLNNNISYLYEGDEIPEMTKELASNFVNYTQDGYMMSVFDILNGADEDGAWTIESVEKDGLNYILTATQGEDCQYKYYFNEDFMYKVEEIDGDYTYITTYNYAIVDLEVPADIKALESSATVDVENVIWDLKDTMSKYLTNDFEVVANGEVLRQYDADKQIMINTEEGTRWYWVNGDDYYKVVVGGQGATKYRADDWNDEMKDICFIADVFNNGDNEYSITISSDGRYYKLTVITNDEDEAVYKYTFNDNEILKIDISYNGEDTGTITYRKANVNLTVPDEIKDMEEGAQQG